LIADETETWSRVVKFAPLGLDRDLHAGALLHQQHHGARVAAAPSAAERNVLARGLEREAGRIVAVGQPRVDQRGMKRAWLGARAARH